MSAISALLSPTTTVLTYGRTVSLCRSTRMYFQASRVGLKSTPGRYTGPLSTSMGCLSEVIASQYSGKRTTNAHATSST